MPGLSPYVCAWCRKDQLEHGIVDSKPYGKHAWIAPSDALIKARRLVRR